MRKNNSRVFALAIGAILSPLAVAAGNAIVQGIIGNRADDLFSWLLEHLGLISWLVIFTGVLSLITCYLFFALFHLHQKIKKIDQHYKHIVGLDNALLKLLTLLVLGGGKETDMRSLVNKLLHDAREAFPEARRASLFLPDQHKEYLLPGFSTGWGGEGANPGLKFYIGNQHHDRLLGSAGEAFLQRKILVTRFEEEEGYLKPSRNSYVFSNEDHSALPYRVLVCVPIMLDEKTTACLGVVCFDSKNPGTFDPPEIQTILKLLGTRIAVAVEIYQHLQNS